VRLRPLATFVAGIVFATGVIGTTAWLRAADDNVINACANKKTGGMRYLTKGSCNKKTETQLSWNQTGIAGPSGPKGEAGASGTKGDTGAAGRNGQNVHVIDAAGRDHGLALGVFNSGMTVHILFEGGIWALNTDQYSNAVAGAINQSSYYSDSTCTARLWFSPSGATPNPRHARGSYLTSGGALAFVKPTGTPFPGTSLSTVYRKTGATCGVENPVEYSGEYFTNVEPSTGPTFTPPFSLIER